MEIRIKKADLNIDNLLPEYQTKNSSGMDISSSSNEIILLEPGVTKLIPTNLIFEIPSGYEGQVRPRSGLAIKHGIGILNSPGTIDADYRGELKIILTNFGKEVFKIKFGDRIAQLVIAKIEQVKLIYSDELSGTSRGEGGFGHTGSN